MTRQTDGATATYPALGEEATPPTAEVRLVSIEEVAEGFKAMWTDMPLEPHIWPQIFTRVAASVTELRVLTEQSGLPWDRDVAAKAVEISYPDARTHRSAVCPRCGVGVVWQEKHSRWHQTVDR